MANIEKIMKSDRRVTSLKARIVSMTLLALLLPLPQACKKEAAPETVVTVQAEHPERGPITEHIFADAVLAPLAQAALAAKISAPVRRFYVQRGSKVKQGELLATLENGDLAAAALDNKGAYIAAEAAYATATRAQVPEDTQKAELDVAQAKANLDLNLSIVKSRKELLRRAQFRAATWTRRMPHWCRPRPHTTRRPSILSWCGA
jgi:HlyD family secretion protein